MSEPDFPEALVHRCGQVIIGQVPRRIVIAILRECGYAEMVAALKRTQGSLETLGYMGYAYNDINAALKKAGAL